MPLLHPTRTEISNRLLKALTPGQATLLGLVAEDSAALHLPLYIVGGYVRDLLLDRPGVDFDLVVEGDAIRLGRSLAKKHGGRVTVHSRFGTGQWFLPDSLGTGTSGFSSLDLVTARSETYQHPAALPTVKAGTLEDDLRRRDFTINALALRLDGDHFGELHDVVGGLEDLEKGLVRILHPGSFVDDPTRLFRIVRYKQRYRFHIAPETQELVPGALPNIDRLSAERVRHELDLVLEEENSMAMLRELADLKILQAVHPRLEWNAFIEERFLNSHEANSASHPNLSQRVLGWSLWLMHVSPAGLNSIDKRLHFDAHTRETVRAAAALYQRRDSLTGKKPSACVRRLEQYPLGAVRCVFQALPAGEGSQILSDYIETWRHVRPKTNGDDLQTAGLVPGPVYQAILQGLRNAWLDGKVRTEGQEKELLEKLIQKNRKGSTHG